MAHIVPMIQRALVDHLHEFMVVEVDPGDPTKVDVVKMGLLQTDKLGKNIQLGVTGGNHELPDDVDGINTLEKLPKIGMFYHAREIGGGQVWMRRGTVRIECFYIQEKFTEEEAHTVAYDTLGKAMALIETAPVNGLVDDFGERAITIHCYSNTFFQSGGPPKSFIFRGNIFWAVYTERP